MRNKCFGLWKVYLQSKQPMSLGWLLCSTSSMDAELLKDTISDSIENIPVGLQWKTIIIRSQGPIPKEQQVKALHIFVNKLDVNITKPLLTTLYASKTSMDHKFPLHICM